AEIDDAGDHHPRERDEHADVPVDHQRIASSAGPRDPQLDVDAGHTRNLQRAVHSQGIRRARLMWASPEYSRGDGRGRRAMTEERRSSTLGLLLVRIRTGSGLDPQRWVRGRARRIHDGARAVLSSMCRGLIFASAAAGAGCASVPDSPRTPYAVPPPASDPAGAPGVEDTPSFLIADAGPGMLPASSRGPRLAPGALDDGRLGLFAAGEFDLTTGRCTDCGVPPAALWWFRDEVIAVPAGAGTDAGPGASARADGAVGGTGDLAAQA